MRVHQELEGRYIAEPLSSIRRPPSPAEARSSLSPEASGLTSPNVLALGAAVTTGDPGHPAFQIFDCRTRPVDRFGLAERYRSRCCWKIILFSECGSGKSIEDQSSNRVALNSGNWIPRNGAGIDDTGSSAKRRQGDVSTRRKTCRLRIVRKNIHPVRKKICNFGISICAEEPGKC